MSDRLVLGIDTTDRGAHVALASSQGVLDSDSAIGKPSVEQLTRMIRHIAQSAEIELGDLTHLAVALGPGSYTGIRGGIACAQGLAAGLGLPVVGVSALLSHFLLVEQPPTQALLVRQAAADEVFCCFVRRPDGGALLEPLGPVFLCPRHELAARAAEMPDEQGEPARITELAQVDQHCLAVGCALLVAEHRLRIGENAAFEQYQETECGLGLTPAYGKAVAAKTLAERGIHLSN